MKLYRVELQGLKNDYGAGSEYGVSYVVATDPTKAYEIVKTFLDERELGFGHDRRLKTITLLADEQHYGERHLLYVQGKGADK